MLPYYPTGSSTPHHRAFASTPPCADREAELVDSAAPESSPAPGHSLDAYPGAA